MPLSVFAFESEGEWEMAPCEALRCAVADSVAAAVLDQLQAAIIVLGPEGKVMHANARALDLLHGRGGVVIDADGRLTCLRSPGQDRLPQLHRQGGDAMCVAWGAALPSRRVLLVPLDMATVDGEDVRGRTAVIYMGMPANGVDIAFDTALLSRSLALTPSELHIAIAIAQGHSVRDAAKQRGIAESTARTLLKRILNKAGLSRQAELAAFILHGYALFEFVRNDAVYAKW